MNLTIGVVALAAAAVVYAWGYAQHRRPDPAPWTRSAMRSEFFSFGVMAFVAAATGGLISVIIDPRAALAGIGAAEALVAFGAVAAAIVLVPVLLRPVRAASGAPVVPFPKSPAAAGPGRKMKKAA